MTKVFPCLFLAVMSVVATQGQGVQQDNSGQFIEYKVDTCLEKFHTCDAKLTKLLEYHQGSVPELEEQVHEKVATINLLKNEILHAKNTLQLVSNTAADCKQKNLEFSKNNENLRKQLTENDAITSKQITNILKLTAEINNKVRPCPCDNLQEENDKLKTDLSTTVASNNQLSEEIATKNTEMDAKIAEIPALMSKLADFTSQLENSEKELQCWKTKLHVKNDSRSCLQEAVTIVEDFRQSLNLSNSNTGTMSNACTYNQISVVEALLNQGVDIEQPLSPDNRTCLHYAARYNLVNLAKVLLKRRSKINAETSLGQTPLMLAAWQGHLEVAKVLVDEGADLTIKSVHHYNQTALGIAKQNKNVDFVTFLKQKGALE